MRRKVKLNMVKKRKKIDRNQFYLWSLCIIPMILVFVFSYLPMGGIILAFKNYNYSKGIFGSDWVGLSNFKFFVMSSDFARITWNTLSMNSLFILFGVISSLGVGILLYEMRSRTMTKIYQTILITPNFLSWVVVAYMAYAILHPQNGYLNVILGKVGIEKINWYMKPDAWPIILVIANIWKVVGMDSVIYYAAMMGIDSSLFEAAEVDGANKWQRTRYILIPCLTNLIIILVILKIGNIFRADFGLFYQLPRNVGALYATTDVIDTYIFRAMRVNGSIGMSSAVGLLQSLVGFVLVLVTNFCAKKIDSDSGLF